MPIVAGVHPDPFVRAAWPSERVISPLVSRSQKSVFGADGSTRPHSPPTRLSPVVRDSGPVDDFCIVAYGLYLGARGAVMAPTIGSRLYDVSCRQGWRCGDQYDRSTSSCRRSSGSPLSARSRSARCGVLTDGAYQSGQELDPFSHANPVVRDAFENVQAVAWEHVGVRDSAPIPVGVVGSWPCLMSLESDDW